MENPFASPHSDLDTPPATPVSGFDEYPRSLKDWLAWSLGMLLTMFVISCSITLLTFLAGFAFVNLLTDRTMPPR